MRKIALLIFILISCNSIVLAEEHKSFINNLSDLFNKKNKLQPKNLGFENGKIKLRYSKGQINYEIIYKDMTEELMTHLDKAKRNPREAILLEFLDNTGTKILKVNCYLNEIIAQNDGSLACQGSYDCDEEDYSNIQDLNISLQSI